MNFTPDDIARAFLLICIGLAILVPVVGITARIALKPIAEMMARMREGDRSNQELALISRRLDGIEREVVALGAIREQVDRLREAQDFELKLAGEKQGVRSIDSGSGG